MINNNGPSIRERVGCVNCELRAIQVGMNLLANNKLEGKLDFIL